MPTKKPSALDEWIDKQEVMEKLHVSSRTLQSWRTQGILCYSRIGSKIYYREKDLQEMLLRHMNRNK